MVPEGGRRGGRVVLWWDTFQNALKTKGHTTQNVSYHTDTSQITIHASLKLYNNFIQALFLCQTCNLHSIAPVI